jgi:hypothetical protein
MSRCLSLGDAASRVLLVVENLPVEIMQLRAVLIGNSDKTDACPNKENGNEGAKGSEASHEDTGFLYLLLAFFSEYSQELVSTISRNLRFHVTTVETGTSKQEESGRASLQKEGTLHLAALNAKWHARLSACYGRKDG